MNLGSFDGDYGDLDVKSIALEAMSVFAEVGVTVSKKETYTGTVKFFDKVRGFGFITPDAGTDKKRDLHVDWTEIIAKGRKSLNRGERVEFKLKLDEEGRPAAADVRVIEG